MTVDKTNECAICGKQEDSTLTMISHVKDEHSLDERLNALILKEQPAEDTHA
jgi:hypothetical protein